MTGRVAVLDRADVDTDQIIPKQFLKRIERTGYGEFLFFDWMKDPEFELQPARVRRARRSWSPAATSAAARRASTRLGARRTTASRASSRRRSATSSARTALKNGLLPIVLPRRTSCELIGAASPSERADRRPRDAGDPRPAACAIPFEFDPSRGTACSNGLDDIALTLEREDEIAALRAAHPAPVDTTALPPEEQVGAGSSRSRARRTKRTGVTCRR